jgi:hypothetical protein
MHANCLLHSLYIGTTLFTPGIFLDFFLLRLPLKWCCCKIYTSGTELFEQQLKAKKQHPTLVV